MASRIRNPFRSLPRRRAEVAVLTDAYRGSYKPKHCAGTSCFHDHHGEPFAWRNFHGAVS